MFVIVASTKLWTASPHFCRVTVYGISTWYNLFFDYGQRSTN